MARIPDDELERIKRETDLVALVQAAGVELRRHGANLVGRCPFHDDQGPSLVVTPGAGKNNGIHLWHCLGACQAGGSAIDWVMRTERVSFRHAVELLRVRLGGANPTSAAPAVSLAPLAVKARDAEIIDDAALVREVLDFYHETLKASPEAVDYLEQRGLNSVALIDHFRLGYANRTLAYRLPAKSRKAGADLRGRLERLGLLRASGHEHFRGSIVVPILGERGQLVQMYGRKIGPKLREGTPLHCYLPGPHAAVWNVDALASSKEIILCEALFDAMTFWAAGFTNVITSYGVSGFTDAHRAALRRYGTERVLVAYDADEAGDRAAEHVAEELTRMGIECYRVHFPRGMDANAYALAEVSNGPASESLGALLRGATWLGRDAPIIAPVASSISSLAAALSPVAVASPAPLVSALASPVPSIPPSPLTVERRGDDVVCTIKDRTYRVRGLAKNLSPDALRVNLLVKRGEGDTTDVHVDTLDLYVARVRGLFIAQAAKELGLSEETIKRDVGAVILALETLVTEQIAAALAPAPSTSAAPAMSEAEREAALAMLRDPQLLDRILADFERAGVVGEETNTLVGYLAAMSRKLPEPLAIIIQSASAAGKTSLMDAVLAFVPTEERVQYSAMTGQALFYMAETNLKHKVLAVVEEEGAERASYALKLLQSEGELTIASTGKDPETGKLVTHEYRVEGPVMIMLTTTAVELDEELVNRALVLTVDEDREQTRAIHQRQRARRTLDGRLASVATAELLALHRNAQRLLEPITIVNPYAPQLTFVDARTRTRRDHEKYLTLIDVVALVHQHQRERKTVTRGAQSLTYIEVTREDIAVANRLAAAVLGRSLDELPPQTRRFLTQLDTWITRECTTHRGHRTDFRFLAREARDAIGLGPTQVKLHLHRLVELEYVLVHRAPRGQGVSYELVYTAAEHTADATIFSGLRDVEALTNTTYDGERSDLNAERSGVGRPVVGGRPGDGRAEQPACIVRAETDLASVVSVAADLRVQGTRRDPRRTAAAVS
jgi:DNA primase catalytic core